MTQTPHSSSERPALSAVRRALPVDRQHLFLRLMPYSYSAPEEYGDLQALVHECLTVDDPLRRATALTQLLSLFDGGLRDVPRHHDLIAEIASNMRLRCFSCVAAEAEFVARLDMVNVVLDEFQTERGTAGIPLLVGKVHWHQGEPLTIRRALDPLLDAVVQLTSQPAEVLAGMPLKEQMAAIRLIRLFCLFGRPGTSAPVQQARLHFLRTVGIPVWRALAGTAFDGRPVDPGMYGEPAIRQIELALCDGAYAAGEGAVPPPPRAKEDAVVEMPTVSLGPAGLWHTFVIDKFPPARDDDDKALLKRYEALRHPMVVAQLPTLAELDDRHALLRAEFPWAEPALGAIFDELRGRGAFGAVRLGFHPVLLVGPSGTGKSRLARRLASVFGIQAMTTSLAGATDAMSILGTARGWSSGQPSPLLQPLLKGCASVLMCFDELDKAADMTRNSPSVQAALLSLLEPEEARRRRDPYLQVECDLSPLLFVLTCNDTTHLSAALRSRLRILAIERPTAAHLLRVVPYVLRDIEQEWGLPSGALDGMPVQPRSLHGLSSLRELRRAVAAAARAWISDLAGAPKH